MEPPIWVELKFWCKNWRARHLIACDKSMAEQVAQIERQVNRRGEARFAAKGQVRYLPTRAAKEWKFLTARLLDCSPHGIAIECTQPMDVGDDFIVKVRVGKLHLAVYRVQNCRPTNDGHRIGGEFVGLLIDPGDVDHDAIVKALAGAN